MKYCLLFIVLFASVVKQKIAAQSHAVKPATVISYPCAVIISPTLKQVNKLKKQSPQDYDSIMDDDINYQSESGRYLDSVKIKQIHKYAQGIMILKTRDGKVYTINLSKYFFAVLLFNGKSEPVEADMTMMADSYSKYMK